MRNNRENRDQCDNPPDKKLLYMHLYLSIHKNYKSDAKKYRKISRTIKRINSGHKRKPCNNPPLWMSTTAQNEPHANDHKKQRNISLKSTARQVDMPRRKSQDSTGS